MAPSPPHGGRNGGRIGVDPLPSLSQFCVGVGCRKRPAVKALASWRLRSSQGTFQDHDNASGQTQLVCRGAVRRDAVTELRFPNPTRPEALFGDSKPQIPIFRTWDGWVEQPSPFHSVPADDHGGEAKQIPAIYF